MGFPRYSFYLGFGDAKNKFHNSASDREVTRGLTRILAHLAGVRVIVGGRADAPAPTWVQQLAAVKTALLLKKVQ